MGRGQTQTLGGDKHSLPLSHGPDRGSALGLWSRTFTRVPRLAPQGLEGHREGVTRPRAQAGGGRASAGVPGRWGTAGVHQRVCPLGVSSQVCSSPWFPNRCALPPVSLGGARGAGCWACKGEWLSLQGSRCHPLPTHSGGEARTLPPLLLLPPPPPAAAWPPQGADPDPTRPPTSQLGGSQRERREEKNRRDLSCLGLTAERVIARPAWQFLIILSLFSALRGDSQCLAVCSERPRGAWRSGGSELPLLAVLFGARSDLSRGSR